MPAEETSSEILRPTFMEVSLSALAENLTLIRSRLQPSTKLMAVVKANAYGHGLIPSANCFLEAGADCLGVAFVEEGIKLRQAGVKAPILVFGGIYGGQIKHFLEYDLALTASSVEKLDTIEAKAKELNTRANVHLKIDTGMERIGVHYYNAEKFLERSLTLTHTNISGVFSHFASAADDDEFTKTQLDRFTEAASYLDGKLQTPPLKHIANSAAAIKYPEAQLDMVRCGIALYGVYPCPSLTKEIALKPAMRLISKVVYFKVVRKGDTVGYGRTWTAPEETRLVTIPIGYGDGYFRSLSNKGEVLIRGKRYPIVGRVSMDQIIVNVFKDNIFNEDEVVLIGSQEKEAISAGELANLAGSYSYEILTATNTRVPRVYV